MRPSFPSVWESAPKREDAPKDFSILSQYPTDRNDTKGRVSNGKKMKKKRERRLEVVRLEDLKTARKAEDQIPKKGGKKGVMS